MDLISGAVALNARLKDMPLAEGDETYELKGGFNSQVFVMTGNVAKTPSFGAGTLDAGYLRTYVNGLSISGSAELPKLDIYNFQEGIFVTEPDSTAGWSFPSTIGQNVAVYSSQFDSSEVWMGEYFDGADKSVGVVTADSSNANLSLKDCYLDPSEAAAKIFIGGGSFLGRGDTTKKENLENKFSYTVNGQPRVYVRPNSKSRMKGLWTATADTRNEKEQWSIYTPFWKWDKIQPILKYGAVGAQAEVALEDKDATTNNTIFNHISTSGDFGDITSMTGDSPLLESKVEISTMKSKTGGTSLRMYHLWQFSEAANRNVEMSLGDNYVNPQVAKAAIYDIPIPTPLDLGAFDYMVSSSTGPAVALSGTASWASGSVILTGATVYSYEGTTISGNADVSENISWGAADPIAGQGVEGTGIPSGAIIESVTGTPVTAFTMNVAATTGASITITGSSTRWAAGLQDTTIEGVVSGSMIRQGYQNYIVRTIDSHYEMSVDRPLTATTNASVTGASSLTVSGPIGAESGKTIYNIDTDVAKSFTSGAHLTDKRLIFPEIDITMNIAKLQQSPAINPNAVSGYVGRNGRQYYKAGRGYKNSVGSQVEKVALGSSDIDLNTTASWEKGGPLTSLLRSVVVTFSSYKSDSFDTLDDFIDYGMNRYYCEQHDAKGVQDQGYGYNVQNDTQLCGIVFQRPFGNAEDGVDEDTGQPTSDESKGHVYAYALPVSKWIAPQAYGVTPGTAGRNLNSSTYGGNYGLHAGAGMALIDNSATTQIQGNTSSNIGIKNIVVQPKYDGKYWDPDLNGTCSLAEGAATNSPSRQTCEQSYMQVNNDWDFESGSTTVLYEAATMDPDLEVGQIITNHTDGTVIPSGTRLIGIDDGGDDTDITLSQPATKNSGADSLYAWGTWKPDQYTNINGALEPHWVKIPLDEFFTMKFVFDKYASFGSNSPYGATYSYQDYTTGLPSDYQLYQEGASSEIYGVPIRCYFDGGLSGSTNLGNPIKQGEDAGPTGSTIETLPYINLPMMFYPVNAAQSYQGFTQSTDNWRGMVESWPKHMTIWVNNYRYTQYNEGDADETNALFRGAQLKGTKGAADCWDTGKYIWESAKRHGADSVLYGNAQAGATGETGAADEFYLNPEVEVFIDSIELKYFNHPITNHSIQAGEMQRFINLQNNKILTPVTTNTWNTVQHGSGYASLVPEDNSEDLRTKKAFNHDGKWTPRNPGLNISIGFKDDPATYFPIEGTSGTGDTFGSGKVHDIYLLLNNFSTAQFGRIDQIAPSVAWKPVAGAWSLGVEGGTSANFTGWLGSEFRGRAWASGCTIDGGTGTDKNRASWAGSGYTGSNGGVSTEYAGWAFYPIETAAGEAFDGKFGFGAGANDWLSCDGMTQKGFLRMSQDLTYNDSIVESGASLDRKSVV